eukprot:7016101-Karenia_brevis.AAC.1
MVVVRGATSVSADCVFCCDVCGKVFKSKQGLAVHRFSSHALRPAVWTKMSTTHCIFCMLEFDSFDRCAAHISKSRRCCMLYQMFVPTLDEGVRRDIEQEAQQQRRCKTDAGWKFNKAGLSAVRLCGPFREESFKAGICHKNGTSLH